MILLLQCYYYNMLFLPILHNILESRIKKIDKNFISKIVKYFFIKFFT